MKYQIVVNGSKKETLKLDTLRDALDYIGPSLRYEGRSYIGGFPYYTNSKGKTVSIQGYIEIGSDRRGVVCSLPEKEVERLDANGGHNL